MRIVIVDDSELIRERVQRLVAAIPAYTEIYQARNIAEAERIIKQKHPDVITLDIRLPDGSGINLLERLNAGATPAKIIVLTSFPYPEYKTRCLQLGAHDFLEKTEDFHRLSGILTALATQAG